MPIIKSAKKKLRQDKSRHARNRSVRKGVKRAIKKATAKTVSTAYSAIDKAAKKGVIHKRKAARLKSRVGKLK